MEDLSRRSFVYGAAAAIPATLAGNVASVAFANEIEAQDDLSASVADLLERVEELERRVSQLEGNGSGAQSMDAGMEGDEASVISGMYLVGRDIPEGFYTFRILSAGYADIGVFKDQDSVEVMNTDPYWYEDIGFDSATKTCSVGLEAGVVLVVSTYNPHADEQPLVVYSVKEFVES